MEEKQECVKAMLLKDGRACLITGNTCSCPDYRHFAGAERLLIKEFNALKSEWRNEGRSTVKCTDSFLRHASSSGLLIDEDGKPIKLKDGLFTISVNIEEDEGKAAFSITAGGKKGIKPVTETMLKADDELIEITGSGNDIPRLRSYLEKPVKKENLPLFLSILLSLFDYLDITYKGYDIALRKPLHASPALIFKEIDEYGFLHILADYEVDGFPTGTVTANGITRAVSIIDEERTVEIRDIIFAKDSRAILYRLLGRGHKDAVYEENGLFIIEGEFAATFIEKNFLALLSSFKLYQAEVLSHYKVRYTRPRVHFRFSSGLDFLEGDCSVDISGYEMSLDVFLSSYRKDEGYVLLNDKSKVYVDTSFMQKLERVISRKNGKTVISAYDLPYLEQWEDADISGKAAERIKSFYKGLNDIGNMSISPEIRTSKLRPYQENGYRWLRYLHDKGMGGCLADEMGLGKTVEVIALLNDVCTAGNEKPSLLVAPRSIIYNWLSEIERFGINIRPVVYYGPERDPEKLKEERGSIIISSYAVIRNDMEIIKDLEFNYVILDESQIIKHFNTRTAQAVCSLKAEHRLALSGTPIENDLGELFSLFRFINPAIFPSPSAFDRDFVRPVMNDDKEAMKALRTKIYPFIMRRVKKDVLAELPEKTEQVAYIDMEEEHRAFYESRRRFLKEQVEKEISSGGVSRSSFIILQALTELRQIAALPEGKMETGHVSAKREYLMSVLPEITSASHKVLIFTSFLDTIEKLGRDLENEGIGYITMTGATRDREALITRFQTDPETKVFLMTLKTGGVGLNLTAADYVFIFDPWWNGAAEDQAINRTHRIGQKNPVFCYRLIAKGTIEEKMLELQNKKKELSSALITSDGMMLKFLSEEEITSLLE